VLPVKSTNLSTICRTGQILINGGKTVCAKNFKQILLTKSKRVWSY
jgi:hypothetical protein